MENVVIRKSYPISNKLSCEKYEIIKASQSPKVFKVITEDKESYKQLRVLIGQIIEKASFLGDSKAHEYSQEQRADFITEIIKSFKDYKWISVQEVGIILVNGLKGNYGEYFGFKIKSVEGWIKHYNETVRREAWKEQLRFQSEIDAIEERARQQALKLESEKRNQDEIKVLIESYSNVEKWQDIPSHFQSYSCYFDYMKSNNMLTVSEEEQKKIQLKYFAIHKKSPSFLYKRTEFIDAKARLSMKDEVFRREMFKIIKNNRNV